jgi:hypothetical protein
MRVRIVACGLLAAVVAVVLPSAVDYGAELYRRVTLPAAARPWLAALQPEEVIERCGRPNLRRISDFVLQEIYYRTTA